MGVYCMLDDVIMSGSVGDRMTGAVPTQSTLAEMIIEDVLTRWPETAVVFHRHKMACPGCAVAGFYTIADAADIYNLPRTEFVAELAAVIGER